MSFAERRFLSVLSPMRLPSSRLTACVVGLCSLLVLSAEASSEAATRQQQHQGTNFWPLLGAGLHDPNLVNDAYGNPQTLIHGGMAMGGYLAGAPTMAAPGLMPGSVYGAKQPLNLGDGGGGGVGSPNQGSDDAGPGFYQQRLPNMRDSMKVPLDFAGPNTGHIMAAVMNSHALQQHKIIQAIQSAEVEAHHTAHQAAVAAMAAKTALWNLQQARRAAHFSRGVLASLHRELAALDLSKERVIEQQHLNALQNQLIATESLVPFGGVATGTSPLSAALEKSKKMITAINTEIHGILAPKDAAAALTKFQDAEKKEDAAHKELEAAAKLREESDKANTVYAPDLIAAARLKLAGMTGSGNGSGSAGSAARFAESRSGGAAAAATGKGEGGVVQKHSHAKTASAAAAHPATAAPAAAPASPHLARFASASLATDALADKAAGQQTLHTQVQGHDKLLKNAASFRFRSTHGSDMPSADAQQSSTSSSTTSSSPVSSSSASSSSTSSTSASTTHPTESHPDFRASLGGVFGPLADSRDDGDLAFSRFQSERKRIPDPPAPADAVRPTQASSMLAPVSPSSEST